MQKFSWTLACKRDPRARDRDETDMFGILFETGPSQISRDRDVDETQTVKIRFLHRRETETSRPRLHPCFELLRNVYIVEIYKSLWTTAWNPHDRMGSVFVDIISYYHDMRDRQTDSQRHTCYKDVKSPRLTWSRGQNFRLSSWPRCQSSKSHHLRYVLLW